VKPSEVGEKDPDLVISYKSPRVLFDGTMINPHPNGIGNDSIRVKSFLADQFATVTVARFKDQSDIPGLNFKVSNRRKISNLKMLLFGQSEKVGEFDDLFFQSQVNSLATPITCQTFTRIHDLFPISNPEWFSKRSAKYFERCFKKLRKSNIFLCNSRATADSLRKYLGDERANIEVVYCALPDEKIYSCNNCQGCNLHLSSNYGVAIGTIEPRKDYDTLLMAWRDLNKINFDLKLVIIGNYGWKQRKIATRLSKDTKSKIHWLSHACDGSTARIREESKFFVSTSLDEGFNLAAAEACQSGTTLILSDIPVHRETHPEAIFFKPRESKDLVSKILELSSQGFQASHFATHPPYSQLQFNLKMKEVLSKYGY
jgi:glycosyltransferase involved in cell wall biosynthesis